MDKPFLVVGDEIYNLNNIACIKTFPRENDQVEFQLSSEPNKEEYRFFVPKGDADKILRILRESAFFPI